MFKRFPMLEFWIIRNIKKNESLHSHIQTHICNRKVHTVIFRHIYSTRKVDTVTYIHKKTLIETHSSLIQFIHGTYYKPLYPSQLQWTIQRTDLSDLCTLAISGSRIDPIQQIVFLLCL